MTADMIIRFAIMAFGSIVSILYFFVRWRNAQVRLYEKHADAFFAALRPLEQDSETPDYVLNILLFLNEKINQKREAWIILQSIGRLKAKGAQSDETGSSAFANELKLFSERRPELYKNLVAAMIHAVLAITYLDSIAGPIVRRAISERLLQSSMTAPRIVSSLQRLDPLRFGGPIATSAHAA